METILQRLTELEEVHDAILVGKDGLIVSGMLRTDEEEMIGAISATAFGSLSSYTGQLNHGEAQHVILETKLGAVHMQEAGDLILVVITRGRSNLGRVRLEMKKACRQLNQLVASY
ncbi:MAG: roadblock/LC7 domain-containing protein [Ktedonobacteraceae bacterium]|nr:roadblock/LC7 domain-containing protein [Ktedonobacteraceae bacterium]